MKIVIGGATASSAPTITDRADVQYSARDQRPAHAQRRNGQYPEFVKYLRQHGPDADHDTCLGLGLSDQRQHNERILDQMVVEARRFDSPATKSTGGSSTLQTNNTSTTPSPSTTTSTPTGTPSAPTTSTRRIERTGEHNNFDGKPGQFRRLQCSDQHEDLDRQPGECRQLKRQAGTTTSTGTQAAGGSSTAQTGTTTSTGTQADRADRPRKRTRGQPPRPRRITPRRTRPTRLQPRIPRRLTGQASTSTSTDRQHRRRRFRRRQFVRADVDIDLIIGEFQ